MDGFNVGWFELVLLLVDFDVSVVILCVGLCEWFGVIVVVVIIDIMGCVWCNG